MSDIVYSIAGSNNPSTVVVEGCVNERSGDVKFLKMDVPAGSSLGRVAFSTECGSLGSFSMYELLRGIAALPEGKNAINFIWEECERES